MSLKFLNFKNKHKDFELENVFVDIELDRVFPLPNFQFGNTFTPKNTFLGMGACLKIH